MKMLRFGLSAVGIALFAATGLALVAAFLFEASDMGFLAWAKGLTGPLFVALVIVLVLRQSVIWLEGRPGGENG